jgi:hypothetical protein
MPAGACAERSRSKRASPGSDVIPAGACAERSRSKPESPGCDVIPASEPESPYTVPFTFYRNGSAFCGAFLYIKNDFVWENTNEILF